VPQIEIGKSAGQPFRLGQAVAGIILREPGDIQRMPDPKP